jgi:CBS domain-containing protein
LNVEEVMTSNPVTVSMNAIATRVRSIFREEDFRCIPVVSGDHLEGLITRGDILNISATKSNIEARGIMERPQVILTPKSNILEAAKKLLFSEEIQAPVVEKSENFKLVGIVSVVDILQGILEEGLKPYKKTLGDIMTKNVVYCDFHDMVSKVWNQMNQSGYSGVPVLKKGKLIGMITRKDLINSGQTRMGKESDYSKRSIAVEKVMKTPPMVGTFEMPVEEAAELMVQKDIGRLPVVEKPMYVKKEPNRSKEADLIGIVAREDVLRSYVN